MTLQNYLNTVAPFEGFADFVLWNRTPFPFTELTERDIYKAADGYLRARRRGNELCMLCQRVAVRGRWECEVCAESLRRINAITNAAEELSAAIDKSFA